MAEINNTESGCQLTVVSIGSALSKLFVPVRLISESYAEERITDAQRKQKINQCGSM